MKAEEDMLKLLFAKINYDYDLFVFDLLSFFIGSFYCTSVIWTIKINVEIVR